MVVKRCGIFLCIHTLQIKTMLQNDNKTKASWLWIWHNAKCVSCLVLCFTFASRLMHNRIWKKNKGRLIILKALEIGREDGRCQLLFADLIAFTCIYRFLTPIVKVNHYKTEDCDCVNYMLFRAITLIYNYFMIFIRD